ncbi:hypothetical protein AVEN_106402-1 [Araneus ventricosus]|uniref:Uncharacterized protein n=1 Tax=Araneus ventricosus TaxID=182803 RepID=A0A4Y2AUU9_ARAVE|nr:hypothetical protein AVEN_106402-1 [Araneus ventricosus]
MGHPPRSAKEPSINFLPTFSFPLSRSDLSPVASLSASDLPSNPPKSLFEVPQLKDHWSTNHPRQRKFSKFFYHGRRIKGQTPHAKFPENQRGKGSYFLYPFSGEKKNGQEKERVFLTRQMHHSEWFRKQPTMLQRVN